MNEQLRTICFAIIAIAAIMASSTYTAQWLDMRDVWQCLEEQQSAN
jgi:hypothetical protein